MLTSAGVSLFQFKISAPAKRIKEWRNVSPRWFGSLISTNILKTLKLFFNVFCAVALGDDCWLACFLFGFSFALSPNIFWPWKALVDPQNWDLGTWKLGNSWRVGSANRWFRHLKPCDSSFYLGSPCERWVWWWIFATPTLPTSRWGHVPSNIGFGRSRSRAPSLLDYYTKGRSLQLVKTWEWDEKFLPLEKWKESKQTNKRQENLFPEATVSALYYIRNFSIQRCAWRRCGSSGIRHMAD